jgi:uncharacterized protein YdhG (YjbR/CyaY superfamily)
MHMPKPVSVDAYIASFPEDVQARLHEVRALIRAAAPDAGEAISYGMPVFTLVGYLIYYAGYKQHIGLYPITPAIEALGDAIAPYRAAKATLRFAHSQPLPRALITRIVKARVRESKAKR